MKVQTEQGRVCLAASEFIFLNYILRKALKQSKYHLRPHRSTTEPSQLTWVSGARQKQEAIENPQNPSRPVHWGPYGLVPNVAVPSILTRSVGYAAAQSKPPSLQEGPHTR